MNSPKALNLFGIFCLILFSALFAAAQKPTPQPTLPPPTEDSEVIRVESRLVIVPVSITDAEGQPVTGLKKEDFIVKEENKVQEVAQVSDAEKVPLEIALLFDVSASTDTMFNFELETAAGFLQSVMRPDDRATIFTVGERPIILQARDSADKASIAVKSIRPTKQFTAFYDSVAAAAEYLKTNTPLGRRKVILAISDGEDTNSTRIATAIQRGYSRLGKKIDTIDTKTLYEMTVKNRDEASTTEQNRIMKILQDADAVFYSVNPAGASLQLNKMSMRGQVAMERFANETGGTAYLSKFQPVDMKDQFQNTANLRANREALTKIFRRLTNELQAQYLVQYYSETDFPQNKYVKLEAGLKNPAAYRVRSRQGYFVQK